MKTIQMLSIDAAHKSIKGNRVTTSISIYVDKRIVNALDAEDQDKVKELSEELGGLLADGLGQYMAYTAGNTVSDNLIDEFMEYVKNKAATDSDAADVYNIFKKFEDMK